MGAVLGASVASPGDGAGALWCSGAAVGGMYDRRDLLPLRDGAAAADGALLGAWAGADMGTVAECGADDSNDLLVLCIDVASVCKRRPAETGDSVSICIRYSLLRKIRVKSSCCNSNSKSIEIACRHERPCELELMVP